MSRKSGDYYPAVCPDCGDSGCAGYEYPVRVFWQDNPIIMVIRRPPDWSPGRHIYRACRFTRRNFLEELAGVIMARIRLEDNLKLWHGHIAEATQRYQDRIAALWGGHDCAEYQYRISGVIRRENRPLKKNFLRSREQERKKENPFAVSHRKCPKTELSADRKTARVARMKSSGT